MTGGSARGPSPDEARRRAHDNFLKGYNCAQSVLEVFCDALKLDRDTALRAAQVFGGGTCRMREMCGTVSGMLLAVGYLEGSADPCNKAAKDALYKAGQRLAAEFKAEYGSFICRELLGLAPLGQSQTYLRKNTVEGDASSPVSEERTPEYYKRRPCPDLCGSAAAIFARYLNERAAEDGAPAGRG